MFPSWLSILIVSTWSWLFPGFFNFVGILPSVYGFRLRKLVVGNRGESARKCLGKAEESSLLEVLYHKNGHFCSVWAASVLECSSPIGMKKITLSSDFQLLLFFKAHCLWILTSWVNLSLFSWNKFNCLKKNYVWIFMLRSV